jgi:hypothetical protein
MPTPEEVLFANLASTRFSDLSMDAVFTTSAPNPDRKVVHIVSKWQPEIRGGTLDVMGRITQGNPNDLRFLIQQSLDQPPNAIEAWRMMFGQVHRTAFVPWDGLPGTEVKNADLVIPNPQAFTAAFSPAGTATQGPGPAPGVACWLVDLRFVPPPDPGPDLARLWIDQSPSKAVDHRIEQYRGGTLLRVIVSEGWSQLGPRTPWGAAQRTFIDVPSGRFTTLTVQAPPDPQVLDPRIFNSGHLTLNTW